MEVELRRKMGDLLYDACQQGDLKAVELTIFQSRSSNPACYEPPFHSIMLAGTMHKRVNVVQYCLEHGIKVCDCIMRTILIGKIRNVFELLLNTNAIDVNHYIGWFGDILTNVSVTNDFEWATLCFSHGANPNANLFEEHMSTLAAVVGEASVGMAQLLIRHGALVRGSGAIVKAAEAGNVGMLILLLDEGADINEVGIEHPTDDRFREDMGTALHRAVVREHENVVVFLLAHGADITVKDPLGRTSLNLASNQDNDLIYRLIKERQRN